MKTKKRYITYDYKNQIFLNETDCGLRSYMKRNYEKEKLVEIIHEDKNDYWKEESHPIKTDKAIKILEDIKKSGCNYVEIMSHTDHIGYVINGLKIRNSTPEEIKKKKEELLKNSDKFKRIQKLREEIEKIKNE